MEWKDVIAKAPTGTGKTELVRVLSQELFDTPETLIRLDMSEFMEKHSVSKIIGSPPGYVATTRRASSPKRCAASLTASFCLTRLRRPTRRAQHSASDSG